MQIFLSIDPFLDKPKPSAMPDWDARRRFGVFFVGVSGLLWPVLGISIVLGPWSSASLQNVKGYADSNDMLLFSCCSTSPLIAISGDSVFRMSPDDSNQGTAISKLFDDSGIEVMVPVWREDAWGTGLQDASRVSFESRGGIVDDGLGYNPETSEFSVEASILADTVQGYVDDHGADKVGVLYVGFGEVLLFMQAASDYEVLGDVRWFGSDANTKESKLVEDSIGLGFVTDTMYTTVQVASGKNDLSQYVDSSLNESIGRIPSTYASSAYDMMWLMGLTIEREQSTDVAVLTAAIPEVAEEYVGALGSTRLNDAGDLAQTNYDVWDIRDGAWTLAGTYFSASDTIALEGAMKDDEMMDDAMDDETDEAAPSDGGCLIATAAYGSELAPQVQFLREIRDNTLLSTASGTSFMTGFNQFYYSFSPAVADLERENAVFRDAVRVAITPALYTLNIMTLADQRLDPLLFFKPAHPAFQARFRQTACSASHSNLWFTSPHTMSLMRSYVFSGFRYLSPMIRHVLTLRIACST